MLKRHVAIPVAIAFVAAAFIIVSSLVFFSRGRSSLIRRKLRIGAALIYLTGLVSCDLFGGDGLPTCYVPLPPPNEFHIVEPSPSKNGIDVDLAMSNILRGVIERREGVDFSFRIEDDSAHERQRDDIAALDGAFDEYMENFEVSLREDLATGSYRIYFFDATAADQSSGSARCRASYRLNVTIRETER
jgi:hypothetical protein